MLSEPVKFPFPIPDTSAYILGCDHSLFPWRTLVSTAGKRSSIFFSKEIVEHLQVSYFFLRWYKGIVDIQVAMKIILKSRLWQYFRVIYFLTFTLFSCRIFLIVSFVALLLNMLQQSHRGCALKYQIHISLISQYIYNHWPNSPENLKCKIY